MHDHHPPKIAVQLEEGPGAPAATVRCDGELDLVDAPLLRDAIDAALELAGTCWIDLRRVTFLDSSTVHELLRAQRAARRRNLCLLIAPCREEAVMRPIELLGFQELLPFAERLVPARGRSC